jgi:hypothetical protein
MDQNSGFCKLKLLTPQENIKVEEKILPELVYYAELVLLLAPPVVAAPSALLSFSSLLLTACDHPLAS